MAEEIKHKQEVANETQEKLDKARRGYAPVAHRCGLLFFLVAKLVQVDVMYQYSLTWFLQLFRLALAGFRRKESSEEPGAEPIDTPVEIDYLAEYFTRLLYSSVCRSLFEKDKLLFSFLLAATLAQARGALSSTDYELLVQPSDGLEGSRQQALLNEFSSWLPDARWAALCQMARKSPQIDAAVRTFKAYAQQWRRVIESPNPLREEFPSLKIDDQPVLWDNFTKLCVVKALAPGKFIPGLREVVILE